MGLQHDRAIFQCRFSFVRRRWKARFDAHLNCLQGHRRQALIAKSGKFVRRVYSRTALDCKKMTVLCFLPSSSWSTLLCERGVGGRGRDLTWQPAVKHQSPAAKATNSDSCDRAAAQVKKRIPEQRTASTEQISKKGIKLIPKTIGNRKGDCAWSCSRWQTQPEKLCKLQSTNQYNVQSGHWFVCCNLQIFLRLCLWPRPTSRAISFSISNRFGY